MYGCRLKDHFAAFKDIAHIYRNAFLGSQIKFLYTFNFQSLILHFNIIMEYFQFPWSFISNKLDNCSFNLRICIYILAAIINNTRIIIIIITITIYFVIILRTLLSLWWYFEICSYLFHLFLLSLYFYWYESSIIKLIPVIFHYRENPSNV